MNKHNPGPYYVGAQNDSLYITAGRPPAPNNDYPIHDADRTVIAKVIDEKSADLLAAAPDMFAALKEAIARAEYVYDSEETLPGWVILARDAIRKAEGTL